jgi:hypothetical protein
MVATAVVTLAEIAGMPARSSAGKATKLPPPATAFHDAGDDAGSEQPNQIGTGRH